MSPGFKDDKAYEYARWAEATHALRAADFQRPRDRSVGAARARVGLPRRLSWNRIATMFTVPTGYNFHDPACKGFDFICWPTVGASSIEYYASKGKGIPGWDQVLLVTTLKRGSLYVLPLTRDGKHAAGHFSALLPVREPLSRHGRQPRWQDDLYRHRHGRDGRSTRWRHDETMQNPGAILAFTYVGEGVTAPVPFAWPFTSPAPRNESRRVGGIPPQFTSVQAAAGRTSYNSNCAVCHGNTLTNGTFAPPLAGEYFKTHGRAGRFAVLRSSHHHAARLSRFTAGR